jgi:hypothetical protein
VTLHLGILLALGCAIASNLAFFYKHRGACAAPPVDIKHPGRSAKALFSSPWFAFGMIVATAAWGLHVAALALAPMSVVQCVLAAGVVLIAIMADRLFGFEVGQRQWWGLALTACGLILLAVTLPTPHGSHSSYAVPAMVAFEAGLFGFEVGQRQWWGLALTACGLILLAVTLPTPHGSHSSYAVPAMVAFEAGLFGIGGLLILGPRVGAPDEHHGVMLGAAAGVLFGVSDVAIKALTGLVGMDGLMGFMTPWFAVAIIASVVAFYASARGLQDGEAVPVIAVTGTAANISCIAGGIIVFGDPLPGDALGIVIQAVAFVMVVVASALTPAPVRAAHVEA